LRKFSAALFGGKILTAEALRTLLTPARGGFACGWLVGSLLGRSFVWHAGGIAGFAGNVTHFVEEGLTVIVLTNRESGMADVAVRTLSAIALGEPYVVPVRPQPVKIDPDILRTYAGRYEIKAGVVITVTVQADRLFVQASGQEPVQAYATSTTHFFLRAVDADLSFVSESGSMTLLLHQNQDFRAKKIE
jgi:hypothetical protein